MKASQLEKEILVVETIIGQLNRCLALYHKEKLFDEFRTTLIDIQTCKRELQRLVAKRIVETEDVKGEAIDGAKIQ